jgi:hypothetical protein
MATSLSTPDKVGATPTLVGKSKRREGRTFQAIAEGLMADGIPSARGKNR